MKFEYAKGAAYASLSAGPIFLLALAIGALVTGEWAWRDFAVLLLSLPLVLLFAIPAGAIIATLPIAVGGFVMSWLGQHYPGTQNGGVWGLAGAVSALPLATLLAGSSFLEFVAHFAATGVICALIVRYGTRWSDDSV